MNDRSLREDIFRYVENLVQVNETCLMVMGALLLFAWINAVLLLMGTPAGSVKFLLLALLGAPFAYHCWVRNRRHLKQFSMNVTYDYLISTVGVQPLSDVDTFLPMPRRALRDPDRRAPLDLVAEIRQGSHSFPELARKLKECELVRPALTYYDAANLFLIQEGLRKAKNPDYSLKIPEPETARH